MWIKVNSATLTPKTIASGASVEVTIKFKGQAKVANTKVDVVFTITPNNHLTINGEGSENDTFTFGTTSAEYTKKVTIKNNHTPASQNSLNGAISIDGTATVSNVKTGTNVGILYK
ncbi:hypothetical protein [Pedobacter sp. D749]|uniref:hypothetical protein n=1 Tax=Pedobacter sp. D749 TaxID=2856523 RepID=UPI001C5951C8|nr:hypothetical protein [Pedobacter sp. D749]QXU42935.1 hypothetical protein KYH19_04880 [Pedobacter sp. D749]